MDYIFLLVTAVVCVRNAVICVDAATNVSSLYKTVFANYQHTVLPKCGPEAVQVEIGLALRQIVDLNEPRQILETNNWVRLRWRDCHLRWNATETGVENMAVPYKSVWVPDITLYDNAQNILGGLADYRPNVYPDGTIYYNFPSVIKSLCKVDVTYFPFDTQTCRVRFGSWSYHGFDLNVSKRAEVGDTTNSVSNGEWTIIGIPVVRHVMQYACCIEPYPDITFYIQLRRKPLFYLLNLLFPCTVISSMAILGFLLPPDSGEKVSLEITVLLSLAVFLLVVSETMPPTSETFPYIGLYFACAMLLVSLSCLMTVTVLNLHFKGEYGKKVPKWARYLILKQLGRILQVKEPHRGSHHVERGTFRSNRVSDVREDHIRVISMENSTVGDREVEENNLNRSIDELKELNAKYLNCNEGSCAPTNELVFILKKQLECVTEISEFVKKRREMEVSKEDWQKMAQVIDRLFLLMFFFFQVTATVGILWRISVADQLAVVD